MRITKIPEARSSFLVFFEIAQKEAILNWT